ncbi:YetF domain-containing protein [Bacillus vallismortis]|uniref:YetF domain-containing protein n=1 Tax=Bacillus vallismortis TaxID=72361 RepID=UPI003B97D00C
MPIPQLIIRLIIAFITLLVLTRLMGRKEIAQLTFFNFVSAISIGTIGASLAIDSTLSIRNGFIALFAWSAFTIIVGFLDIKFPAIRYAVEGQPVILIRKGKIMDKQLRSVRLDLDALQTLLRKKNIFSLADADYAIFETDGSLSVLKKQAKQNVTKKDMNVQGENTNPNVSHPASVIADGKVREDNLKKLNLNKQWLMDRLKESGIQHPKEVFYAEVQTDGTLYIDKKENSPSE